MTEISESLSDASSFSIERESLGEEIERWENEGGACRDRLPLSAGNIESQVFALMATA
jgi:hypothetical protein